MNQERGTLLYGEGRKYAILLDLLLALLLFEALQALTGIVVPFIFHVLVLSALGFQLLFGQNTGAGIYSQGLYIPASIWESLRRPAERFVAYCDIVDIRPTRFELHGDVLKPSGLTVRARDGRVLRIPAGMSKVLLHKLKAALGDRLDKFYRPSPFPEKPGPTLWSRLEHDLRTPSATVGLATMALTTIFVLLGVGSFGMALWLWGFPPERVAAGVWAPAAIIALLPAYWAALRLSAIAFSDRNNALVTVWLLRNEGREKLPVALVDLYNSRNTEVGRAARLSELVEILELDLRRGRKRAAASLGAIVVALVMLGGSVPPDAFDSFLGKEKLDLSQPGLLSLSDDYYSASADVNLGQVSLLSGDRIEIHDANVWMFSEIDQNQYYSGSGPLQPADGKVAFDGLEIPAGTAVSFKNCQLRTGSSDGLFVANNQVSPEGAARTLTAGFHLDGSANPRISFQTRYVLARGQDFGYVELSANSGKSWRQLSTNSSSTYRTEFAREGVKGAPAFTGTSAGWSVESVDLSAYRGKDVLIRFRVVTSTTVPGHSFEWYVDHVRIDSIGYIGDEEPSKWNPNGWENTNPNKRGYSIRNAGTLELDRCRAENADLSIFGQGGTISITDSDLSGYDQDRLDISISGGSVNMRDSLLTRCTLSGYPVNGSLANVSWKNDRFYSPLSIGGESRLEIFGCRFDCPGEDLSFHGASLARIAATTFVNGTMITAGGNAQVSLDRPPERMSDLKTSDAAGIFWPGLRQVTVTVRDRNGNLSAGAAVELKDRLGTSRSQAVANVDGVAKLALPPIMELLGSTFLPEVLSRSESALLELCPYTVSVASGAQSGTRTAALSGGDNIDIVVGPSPRLMLDAFRSEFGPFNNSLSQEEYANQSVFVNITVANRGNGHAAGLFLNLTGFNQTSSRRPLARFGPFDLPSGESATFSHPFILHDTSGIQANLSLAETGLPFGQSPASLTFQNTYWSVDVWAEGELEYSGQTLEPGFSFSLGMGSSLSLKGCQITNLSSLTLGTNSTIILDGCNFKGNVPLVSANPSPRPIIVRDTHLEGATFYGLGGPMLISNSSIGPLRIEKGAVVICDTSLESVVVLSKTSLYAVGCSIQAGTGDTGVRSEGGSCVRMENCRIFGFITGIENSHYQMALSMEGCTIENCSDAGIRFSGDIYSGEHGLLKAENCIFSACGDGIDLELDSLDSTSVKNCRFSKNDGYGIRLSSDDRRPDISRWAKDNQFFQNRYGALEVRAVFHPYYGSKQDNWNEARPTNPSMRISHVLPDGSTEDDFDGALYIGSDISLVKCRANDAGAIANVSYEVTIWADRFGFCRTAIADIQALNSFLIGPGRDLEAASVRLELTGSGLVANATFRSFGADSNDVKLEVGWGGKVLASTKVPRINSSEPYYLIVPLGEPSGDGELWAKATAARDSLPGNERQSGGNFTVLKNTNRDQNGAPAGNFLVGDGGVLEISGARPLDATGRQTFVVLPKGTLRFKDSELETGRNTAVLLTGGKIVFDDCRVARHLADEGLPFINGQYCELTLNDCALVGNAAIITENSKISAEGSTFEGGGTPAYYGPGNVLECLFNARNGTFELKNCTLADSSGGMLLAKVKTVISDSDFSELAYPVVAAGGSLDVSRSDFEGYRYALKARSCLVDARECVFSGSNTAISTEGCRLEADSNLLQGARIDISGSAKYSSSKEYNYGTISPLDGLPPADPPLPASEVLARITNNVFEWTATLEVTMSPATIEGNLFNNTYMAITSTGQVLDYSKNNFTAEYYEYDYNVVYHQQWVIGLRLDDGAGRIITQQMYRPGSHSPDFLSVPENGWIPLSEYYTNLSGERIYNTETCITVAPGWNPGVYGNSRENHPINRTTGPLEMKNQDLSFSFPVADIEFDNDDLVLRDEWSNRAVIVELEVRNKGTADTGSFSFSLNWALTQRSGDDDYQNFNSKTVNVANLRKGENRTLQIQLTDISWGYDFIHVTNDDRYRVHTSVLESNYSNQQVSRTFKLAKPPTDLPPRPGQPWAPVVGALSVIALLLVGLYFAARTVARRRRESAELSGRTVPSEVLRQALSARLEATPETPPVAPVADAGPKAPAGAEMPPGPLCPECNRERMVQDGDRLFKCPGCGYMLVPRPEKAIKGKPHTEAAGKGN